MNLESVQVATTSKDISWSDKITILLLYNFQLLGKKWFKFRLLFIST